MKEWFLFLSYFLLIALVTKPGAYGENEASRFNTIKAIVEYHTQSWNSLPLYYVTADRIVVDENTYSDKPPLFSFVSAGVYFFLFSLGLSFDTHLLLVPYLLKIFIVGFASAWLVVLFYRSLSFFQEKQQLQRLLLTVAFGCGTLIFSYASAFNNHSITALTIFWAFLLYKQESLTKLQLFFLGMLLSFTLVLDFVAGGIFLVLFSAGLYAKYAKQAQIKEKTQQRQNTLLFFVLGILPLLLLHLSLNYPLVHSILPGQAFPTYYEAANAGFTLENLPGKFNHASFTAFLLYTFHTLLGMRGLFSYTPSLLFGFFFLFFLVLKKKHITHIVDLSVFLGCIATIGYYCFFSINFGGSAYGSRYLLVLVPLLFYYSCLWFHHISQMMSTSQNGQHISLARILFFAFFATVFFSIFIATIGVLSPWTNTGQGWYAIPVIAILADFSFHLHTTAGYFLFAFLFL